MTWELRAKKNREALKIPTKGNSEYMQSERPPAVHSF